ncbi:uncharacterized protein LOC123531831 [Mercenaria mercenaria]|uniref:uncharacterized protein LOC123531831 n=1 Tax=Mercenaria mercenaria TaxID=6596 RepID=UPI00234E6B20|nr:uncharacterized protein LOC123531831 [Mercenaria mercenaria]
MPACRGYNYVLNIVDCYSRFGFGKALKSKTSKEVAEAVISFIYMYGAPRIVQSDNGREFKNSDLADVVMEFEAIQMHGRPYHPQSQGRVERFNRTMTDYFRHKMVDERNWVSQLPEFYYSYNNRIHRSTRPSTPYQKFFKRPNFAAPVDDKVPYASLTAEEKEFLKTAHLDVEGDTEDIHHDDVVDNVFVATKALSDMEEAYGEVAEAGTNSEEEIRYTVFVESEISMHPVTEQNITGSQRSDGIKYNWTPISMPALTPVHLTPNANCSEKTVKQIYDRESPIPQTETSRGEQRDIVVYDSEAPIPLATGTPEERNFIGVKEDVEPREFEVDTPQGSDLNLTVNEYIEKWRKRKSVENEENAGNESERKRSNNSRVDRKELHRKMFPLEQFNENLLHDDMYCPNAGESVYYRLNPALSAGTSCFNTGFYRPGKCVGVKYTDTGRLYRIYDDRNGTEHTLNRFQIKQA